MAVPSGFYRPVVESFERHGWEAVALPRRGFEHCTPRASRQQDWSYDDEIAVVAEAVADHRAADPDRPIILLGHSLGAQLAVAHDLQRLPSDGLVLVGASVPHFRRYPFGGLPVLAMALAVRPLTSAFGFVPRPAFGGPGATTLMRQWARWAVTGRPPFAVPRRVTTPSLVVKLQGDAYAVSASTDAFVDQFLEPASTTRSTYLRSEAPDGGTTEHVGWVRTPDPVVERVTRWWEPALSSR
ncbi:hypothetical protein HMPREF0063_10708 [Aeromicrobium marinum DSM 15272]|uniref:Serine aminopeptidase S33 domain-containing protein n=1 Tax=Aeromicrobium marinum DSM 15272 TaxID=585531 RepID=E2S9R8_9ACTN|nr:hypothetical protein HMPREF0063_10708 [Aeromicrobium marinum DSM 15272]